MTQASFTVTLLRALGLLGALSVIGCRDLTTFDSKTGEVYCGRIGSPAFQDGFVKEGSPPDLEVALTLDTSKLTSEPGILSSREGSPTVTTGICGEEPLFADAPLRAIPQVERDALSALTFGEGHEHDFFAWVDSTCQGTMLAIVSLLKNNLVELRLFKPARRPPPNAPAGERPGFAVFHMEVRKTADCGL